MGIVVWRNLTQLDLFSQKLKFILLFGFFYFNVKRRICRVRYRIYN
jgi:hypothetical protein